MGSTKLKSAVREGAFVMVGIRMLWEVGAGRVTGRDAGLDDGREAGEEVGVVCRLVGWLVARVVGRDVGVDAKMTWGTLKKKTEKQTHRYDLTKRTSCGDVQGTDDPFHDER
ncbi:MAG: hypothetical protein CL932_11430 [Deltaproteobacteria bacterium]|nr:hypothetical protein [Deltaproteobacteria bacterium]